MGAPSRLALKSFLVKLRAAREERNDDILVETENKVNDAISTIERKLRENL